MLERLPLPTDWTLTLLDGAGHAPDGLEGQPIPATVPGCVHTDLMAAGRLRDPLVGLQEREQEWVRHGTWRYACSFEVAGETLEHDRVELVCEGLDTLATPRINGREVGRADDMHLRHRFDAQAALRPGENALEIDFAPVLPFAEAMAERYPGHAHLGHGSNPRLPFHLVRKMSCSFGWDWGPATVSCGIWRPIRLEARSGTRIGDLRPRVTSASRDRAVIHLAVEVERVGGDATVLHGTLRDPDGQPVWSGEVDPYATQIVVNNPRRWWPVGHGDQPLYTLEVTDGSAGGAVFRRIGLRTARLVTTPDAEDAAPVEGVDPPRGDTFHLEVNGERVFAKGANWIPDDVFPHRVTPERVRERLQQAVDANMNTVRVWGGGTFESHAFYDACDELGLLVWQDFMAACATYPEEGPYPAWFEAEARDNVSRLASHPSLVLWCGCNENFWAIEEWNMAGFGEALEEAKKPGGGRGFGGRYYLDTFPRAIADLDPGRPYWPGSPWSGPWDPQADPEEQRDGIATGRPDARRANADHRGDQHLWDVWLGGGGHRNYLGHAPRFASEYGYHGPPTWPTLARAIPGDQRRWDSPAAVHHNKQLGGPDCGKLRAQDDFGWPQAYDDQLFVTTLMQCRALELGCSWFRALSPWCSGALYWQLNDCWPVTSWSAIDGDGRRKPLWHATRAFFAPRLLTLMPTHLVPSGEPVRGLGASLHNDHPEPIDGVVRFERWRVDGLAPEATADAPIVAAPRERVTVPVLDALCADGPGDLLVATMATDAADPPARALWFGGTDKETASPEPGLSFDLARAGRRHRLTVTAERVCRELCLFPDRLDPAAEADRQRVTLLPGESVAFGFEADRDLSLAELTAPPVLDHANRHGARG